VLADPRLKPHLWTKVALPATGQAGPGRGMMGTAKRCTAVRVGDLTYLEIPERARDGSVPTGCTARLGWHLPVDFDARFADMVACLTLITSFQCLVTLGKYNSVRYDLTVGWQAWFGGRNPRFGGVSGRGGTGGHPERVAAEGPPGLVGGGTQGKKAAGGGIWWLIRWKCSI
jgi:hypothetical protein